VERTRAQINYFERATAFVPSAGVDLPRRAQLISLSCIRSKEMHVKAQLDFTESFSFTRHSFYLSKSGSAIRFLERRARSLVRKKVTFANSGRTGICKRSTGLYWKLLFHWHSFYLSIYALPFKRATSGGLYQECDNRCCDKKAQ